MTVVAAYADEKAIPRSHSATVERRSGNTFSPVPDMGQVKPGESIRLVATGIQSQLFHTPTFRILNSAGAEVFKRAAGATGDTAFVDTVAPITPGVYRLEVSAQSFPFFPSTHLDSMEFEVNPDAPDPPTEPPSKFNFGDFKTLMYVGVGVIGLVALVSIVGVFKK